MALNNPAPLSCQNIVSFDANKTPNITAVSGCNIGCRFCKCLVIKPICGKTGIRTLGTRKGTTVFETVPIDRSGIFPCGCGYKGRAFFWIVQVLDEKTGGIRWDVARFFSRLFSGCGFCGRRRPGGGSQRCRLRVRRCGALAGRSIPRGLRRCQRPRR